MSQRFIKTDCLITMVLFLALVSCAKTDYLEENVDDQLTVPSVEITYKDLLDYFVSYKGISPTKATDIVIEPIKNGKDTVMYLVNYSDGWEVLSGDSRAPRVLMKCASGNVTLDELKAIPGQRAFLSALSANLEIARYDDLFAEEKILDSWNKTEIERGGPLDQFVVPVLTGEDRVIIQSRLRNHLMSTAWGQGAPWNQYAPYTNSTMTSHCYTGCVPVASAQVLYYLHNKIGVPASVYGTVSCNAYIPTNQSSVVLTNTNTSFSNSSSANWGMMPLNQSNTGGSDKVSALMVYLGYLYSANYGLNGTSAYAGNTTSVFPYYFGISCQYHTASSLSFLKSTTDNQIYEDEIPIIMSVSDENTGGGHAIVLDGFKYLKERVTRYYDYYITGPDLQIQPGQLPDWSDSRTKEEESWYVAINWGWNGAYNNTGGNPIWYNIEAAWLVSSYNYSLKNYIIYNFEEN